MIDAGKEASDTILKVGMVWNKIRDTSLHKASNRVWERANDLRVRVDIKVDDGVWFWVEDEDWDRS